MVRLLFCPLLALLLAVAGCGGMRLVESDVSTQSSLPAAADIAAAGYRFERLPSQEIQPQAQAQLEAIVEQALARVGLLRSANAAAARYSVLATARSGTWVRNDEGDLYPIGSGYGGPRVAIGIGNLSRSMAIMMPITYLYRREVSLILRDLGTTQIVYETRASHEGPWADTAVVYAAMFDAALSGFPQAPLGPRRVRIEIPR
jgi:hypothetical protein